MTTDEPTPAAPAPSWRTADIPLPVLIGGIVLVVAAALGLASLGSAFGIAAVAVLLGAVVALFYVWCREQFLSGRR